MSYHLSRRQFLRLASRVIGTIMGITCTFTARTFSKEVRRVQVELKAIVLQPTHWPDGTPKEEGLWIFNEQLPGPTIRTREGEAIRVTVCNTLPEPTSVHWHGMH